MPTDVKVTTIDELTTAATEFDAIKKQVKKLEKRREELADAIKDGLKNGLGVQSPEGNYSAQLTDGQIVLDEKRVTYYPVDNKTIPFFKSKGLDRCIVEAVDRDEMNKAIKEGTFSKEELEVNFDAKEAHVIKVVK